jgi:HAD superfamily hydrolase (TIGR01490 family)
VAVAALFDIDGTLIACQSGPLYMRHLRRTGHASILDLARTFFFLVQYRLGLLDIQRASAASMGLVRGLREATVLDDCRRWYEREVRTYLRPAMAATVEAHRRAGHIPAILTSATRYLAEPLARDIGIEHLIVTQLVVEDGVFTGHMVDPVCYGDGKVHWVERWAAKHDVDLGQSYFYTDSITDVPVLERVGEPRVVNPDPRLRREAARRRWPVFDFDRQTTAAAPLDRRAICTS